MAHVLHWNGKDVPPELRELQPGRYVVAEYAVETNRLTTEEEEGILIGIAEIDRDDTRPADEVHASLRKRLE